MGGTITAHDGGRADAALVQRFRQSKTTRERTAVFADVVRQHRHAVLCSCAERLWPDADAAVATAAGVLVSARLAMADPAKLPRPDRLRGWLLGIAAEACPIPGRPARIDDVDWEAVHARTAVGTREMRDSPARAASLRQWLERIVATLPEPRQRMYDLFVARGLDSRNAALELGTTVAEVRRLRRENRQAILRAFEVTALAAAEAAVDPPGIRAPGCAELRQMLADPRNDDGDPHEDGRRHTVVLSAALRLTLSRHLSECRTCQDRRDDSMARWAPELLPILADAELHEQITEDLQSTPELRQPGAGPGAHRRVAPAGTVTKVVIARSAVAVGAGLVAALLLLAFVWPGVLRGTRTAADVSSPDRNTSVTSGVDAPTVTGTVGGVPDDNHGRAASPGAAGLLISRPPVATGSPAASVQPSVYYTVQPSTAPTSSPARPTSTPSPSRSRTTAPTPSASTSTPKATPTASTSTPTPTTSASTPTPTPSASTSTPTPTTSPSTPAPTPSASTSDTAEPTPTGSASASASPTVSSSTVARSASAAT
jgi:hypothetical protein